MIDIHEYVNISALHFFWFVYVCFMHPGDVQVLCVAESVHSPQSKAGLVGMKRVFGLQVTIVVLLQQDFQFVFLLASGWNFCRHILQQPRGSTQAFFCHSC